MFFFLINIKIYTNQSRGTSAPHEPPSFGHWVRRSTIFPTFSLFFHSYWYSSIILRIDVPTTTLLHSYLDLLFIRSTLYNFFFFRGSTFYFKINKLRDYSCVYCIWPFRLLLIIYYSSFCRYIRVIVNVSIYSISN